MFASFPFNANRKLAIWALLGKKQNKKDASRFVLGMSGPCWVRRKHFSICGHFVRSFCTSFCLSHTGLFYGGVCIAMAALASLMGALLQVSVRLLFHVCIE